MQLSRNRSNVIDEPFGLSHLKTYKVRPNKGFRQKNHINFSDHIIWAKVAKNLNRMHHLQSVSGIFHVTCDKM